ncbi:hypothetical protein K440DRAFT_611843 [Wilcoxina mikolae CBS 423.85]|nr:hypothetical protein K440DRAFT_611843 [Wilcoxina mikolae CBS 423.85]
MTRYSSNGKTRTFYMTCETDSEVMFPECPAMIHPLRRAKIHAHLIIVPESLVVTPSIRTRSIVRHSSAIENP